MSPSIYRTKSGADLVSTLNSSEEWLICSLIHKFGGAEDDDSRDSSASDFIRELRAKLPSDFRAKGNIFVFVDEAHRTQSGKMHSAMKELLPEAMFIGFTGTPLLKADKATSLETFGSFIHTYKFDEAVADGVVLDLRYEARAIDQELKSPEKVDKWFEAKTKGMTDLSRAELKKRWGTMQKVVSSEPRATQIVDDILLDMETKPRLMDGRGNAMLVGQSIYQACKFYELFCRAGFKGKCAIVTSYEPSAGDISKEDSGDGATEKLHQYEIYRQMLADYFDEPADKAVNRVEEFEQNVKEQFIINPGQMRLLIVVDKLLTGFDAPSATYLYIDKKMQDHGLFQAICRVNRLDGDDKDYGYIVDYRDLFNSLESAITDYTSGAFAGSSRRRGPPGVRADSGGRSGSKPQWPQRRFGSSSRDGLSGERGRYGGRTQSRRNASTRAIRSASWAAQVGVMGCADTVPAIAGHVEELPDHLVGVTGLDGNVDTAEQPTQGLGVIDPPVSPTGRVVEPHVIGIPLAQFRVQRVSLAASTGLDERLGDVGLRVGPRPVASGNRFPLGLDRLVVPLEFAQHTVDLVEHLVIDHLMVRARMVKQRPVGVQRAFALERLAGSIDSVPQLTNLGARLFVGDPWHHDCGLPDPAETLCHRNLIEHVGIEAGAGPLPEMLMVRVSGIGQHLTQILIATYAATVLRRARPFAIGADRIADVGRRFLDGLDHHVLLPVVAEVISPLHL